MKTRKLFAKVCIILILFSSILGVFLSRPKQIGGADLVSVADTISDSRLSYYANQYGTQVGGSVLTIGNTAGENQGPSTTNHNLFPGESVLVGNGSTATTYTVDDIIDDATDDKIQLTATVASDDDDNADVVIATRSATHTIQLTTTTAWPNGALRFRVKAGAMDATNDDGLPDQDGFDFSTSSITVTCPANANTTYDFVTGTATASGGTGCATGYHCFECRYSRTGAVGTAFTGTVGASDGKFQIDSLINPAPSTTHTEGTADSYTVIVEHLDSGNTARDSSTIKLAVIESVRVTATVEPILNFSIAGLSSGSTYCGTASADITTTATTIPFSTLSISAFIDAAQQLTVSTNADGGYIVEGWEYDQLGRNGDACSGKGPTFSTPCIADTRCDNGGCLESAERQWERPDVATAKGFGYSMDNNDAASITFVHDSTCWGASAGTFCARQFADYDRNSTPETYATLFSSTTVADSEDADVCYRIVIGTTQEAGDYETYLTYRATATF